MPRGRLGRGVLRDAAPAPGRTDCIDAIDAARALSCGTAVAADVGMNTPITFRDLDPSPALQAQVNALTEKLQQEVRGVTSCRVTIGRTQHSHRRGDLYEVHVELRVPNATLRADLTSGDRDDLYGTVNAAFADLRVRLHQHFERRNEH